MMIKNHNERVVEYWLEQDYSYVNTANITIIRLLFNNKFKFFKKKVLSVGCGTGENLLNFKNRGSEIYGIDIRKKNLENFVKKNNLNKKNFKVCDLNKYFPNFNTSFDLVYMLDTLYYFDFQNQLKLFSEIHNVLKNKGLFLFQYIQELLDKFLHHQLLLDYLYWYVNQTFDLFQNHWMIFFGDPY